MIMELHHFNLYCMHHQWPLFIEHLATETTDGDVHFHQDSDTDAAARKFKDSLSTCGLKQHINELTHQKGHTLDVV